MRSRSITIRPVSTGFAVALLGLVLASSPAVLRATHLSATYTLDADFEQGSMVNVVHDPSDQLQLDDTAEPFNFIWVAVSSEGTVVKIDTQTGAVLGEYRTAPQTRPTNPSRTTVDSDGNAWVANRNESGFVAADTIAPGIPPIDQGMGSAVHIGLEENGQCVDRNGNGLIDTSSGLGDVLDWDPGYSGADDLGGVSTAADECILHFTRVTSTGTRHITVTAANDVWIGGTGYRNFDLVDADTGHIVRHESGVGYGGYGGLLDGSGVIWSARRMLRWDTALALTGPMGGNWDGYGHDSYGLCIDSQGYVWNTALYGNTIRKFAPDGTLVGSYAHGYNCAQGCVVDGNDHVWVAHSLIGGGSVGHLLNDGTFIGNVAVGSGPTGVAVDAAGKIWATNYYSFTASRIDPGGGPIGADGVTPVGAVDLTTVNLGGYLYNYSDMTGSTLIAPPDAGTWTVVHSFGIPDLEWGTVSWTAAEPADSALAVTAASSADGVNFGPAVALTNGAGFTVDPGEYLKVDVAFARAGSGETPILYDLTIEEANQPPDCSDAEPSVDLLWPPNHKFVPISVLGVTDPDGDPYTIAIDSIYQDEPVDTYGDGRFTPDGLGVGTYIAELRAERAGSKKVPGNGRVYHIGFTADDGWGGTCSGEVRVGVPHDQGQGSVPVDDGALYDSTASAP